MINILIKAGTPVQIAVTFTTGFFKHGFNIAFHGINTVLNPVCRLYRGIGETELFEPRFTNFLTLQTSSKN
jgi:hypothetical protein